MHNDIRELSLAELDAVAGAKPAATDADTKAKRLAVEFAHEIMHALASFK